MGMEIERKYLVRDDRWRGQSRTAAPYRQGYLSMDPARSVRVRIAGDSAAVTIKGPSSGAARSEFEYPIPIHDAEEILAELCVKPIIAKTRHIVLFAGHKWEIDEFQGENEGLIIAEVEIDDASREIALPDWAGAEVTGDARYFNLNLVTHPYNSWRVKL